MPDANLHNGLQTISLLFSYPDRKWSSTPIPQGLAEDARTLIAEMRTLDPVALENEYIRLFVNSMPEVPCAPYGSVYLEGTVMGESTLKVAEIYRRHGLSPEEMADHIAVEAEFLAWLSDSIDDAEENRQHFAFLLGHLQKWTTDFFEQVERHDRLGCYRRGARIARNVLLSP
jgi:TorA maturation chaperone TorD